MGRSVYITTPIPTLGDVGKSLKMSKSRQQRLIEIVGSNGSGHFSARSRDASGTVNARLRNRNGAIKRSAPQLAAKVSGLGKKSKRAATN
jgi:hypothetical protein